MILDYVPNHTSDRHPWFAGVPRAPGRHRDARLVPLARPGPGGGPPNNWLGVFGGSAWTLDPATGQYYYHAFLPEQPDLNWRHPAVREAMLDVLRFWLDRGVDGFRVDALRHLVKDDRWRDDPPGSRLAPGPGPLPAVRHIHTVDRPEVLDLVGLMRAEVDR